MPRTTWQWQNITNPTNTITPEYAEAGVCGRFQIAHYGNVDVALTVNNISGAVYAFRLPQ